MSRLAGIMARQGKKNLFKRLSHIGVLFRYLSESAVIVMQGDGLRNKLILFSYYTRIPRIVVKSLRSGKTFRELEEENKQLKRDVTISNKYGRFFCGSNILTVYTVNRNNEKHLYPYIHSNDGIFIDVGAHIGKYSIPAAKNGNNTVISLEPDPYNFELLKKNIILNNCANIICLNKGAYTSSGEMAFFTTDSGEGMHSIYRQPESRHEIAIEVDTLDNIVQQLKIEKPVKLIKIDVEGAEMDVLRGAENILRTDKPRLLIEVWRDDVSRLATVKEYLQGFGYDKAEHLDKENVLFTHSTP